MKVLDFKKIPTDSAGYGKMPNKIDYQSKDGKEYCAHCGGSGVCNKINEDASCSDCVEAAGNDNRFLKTCIPFKLFLN